MGGHHFPAVSEPLQVSRVRASRDLSAHWPAAGPRELAAPSPAVPCGPECEAAPARQRELLRGIRPVVVALWGGHCLVCPLASPRGRGITFALHSHLGLRIKTQASLLVSPLGLSAVRVLGRCLLAPLMVTGWECKEESGKGTSTLNSGFKNCTAEETRLFVLGVPLAGAEVPQWKHGRGDLGCEARSHGRWERFQRGDRRRWVTW